jgi:hypothetical protein
VGKKNKNNQMEDIRQPDPRSLTLGKKSKSLKVCPKKKLRHILQDQKKKNNSNKRQTATTTDNTKQTNPKRHISDEVLRLPQSICRTNSMFSAKFKDHKNSIETTAPVLSTPTHTGDRSKIWHNRKHDGRNTSQKKIYNNHKEISTHVSSVNKTIA